ncbi:MAG: fibrillarin-like rRNA/tRNA 2'-O-methyltransferase [Thermoplasmata archaeon]|jgi:fibrillarin-like pre-rRNA processing protein|nr:fibrillarin-like rRNA/tRNA 2'-O-methyltransferase [Thermoplasmata archaeon]MVT13211.1 fibrillarin-like rRNA/tRNA 2'-O-methyltransferase [Euryarchaeota archaeon]
MKPTDYFNVFEHRGSLYTKNLVNVSHFGEKILRIGGIEYRHWDPYRSKLSASIKKGLKNFPFEENSRILYLGASFGNTVSFLSDICTSGKIFAIEISYKPFSSLLEISKIRKNIFPIFDDASYPENYAYLLEEIDILYQDIAQKNQVDIFLKNVRFFKPKISFLALKTRAIDAFSQPEDVMRRERKKIDGVIETIKLDPYSIGHYMMVVKH